MRSNRRHTARRWSSLAAAGALMAGLALGTLLSGAAGAQPATAAAAAGAQPATGAAAAGATGTTAAGGSPHIMTIMMENTDYSQAAGSPAMPYLNELAHEYADFTQAYGWIYPSLPNYLELLSGTVEVDADCDITEPHCSGFTNPTLVQQLEAAGVRWRGYYQGLDQGCDQGDGSGNYPYWHNAFRYFADFATQCRYLSGFGRLLPDLSGANPPAYAWVVPDLVNSGGDNGTMASGDNWLASAIPQIMATPWYREGGQIVILYDTGYEDGGGIGGASGGHIPMVVVSAHTAGMGVVTRPVTTAGVLRSVEAAYGLPFLGDAADPINGSLGGALVAGLPTGPAPAPAYHGELVTGGGHPSVTPVADTLSLNGVAPVPGGGTIEVGESGGQGVIESAAVGTVTVPGTSNLQGVACATASRCYAVGLGPVDRDEAVLVAIVNGQPTRVTALPAFIGLYGIACPTADTCEAVGYDDAADADAVTTITDGSAGAPQEVPGNSPGGEWLSAVSCPSATQCYAAGLVNYAASIVPVVSGAPQSAIPIPRAWYVSGIDCTAVGSCLAVGESARTAEGVLATLSGTTVTTRDVAGTEYLYGVGCAVDGSCLLAGTSTPGLGQSTGVLVEDLDGALSGAMAVAGTNGLGQTVCGAGLSDCTSVGAGTR